MLTARDEVKQALFVPYLYIMVLLHFARVNNAMDVLRACEERGERVADV